MEQTIVMVFGQITAHQSELEGMKIQNESDKQAGRPLTYPPDAFFAKAEEIRSTVSQLFR